MNTAHPLYLVVLAASNFALVVFVHHVQPGALRSGPAAPSRRILVGLFGLLAVLFLGLWLTMLVPGIIARAALPERTISVLDLAFALPLVALAAVLLWSAYPLDDLPASPMLMKVAVLGIFVFLGTAFTPAFFDGPFLPVEMALYALSGVGPALLIWPIWRALKATVPLR